MIKTTIKILLAHYLLFTLPCFLQNKAEASEETEQYIIERLNSIRSDPLAHAELLGYNRQVLLETLPFLDEMIKKGIKPFARDGFLSLKVNSSGSLEDDFPVLPENDYALTGETKGIVTFLNFMDIGTGVQIILHNLFKKELDPSFKGQRYILSSDFNLAGISFREETTWTRTGIKNSYIITASFGSSLLKSEVQVLNMINQVRAEPLKVDNYIFLNLGAAVDNNLDAAYALNGTYQPLFIDSTLQTYGTLFGNENYLGQAIYYGYSGIEVNKSPIVEIFPVTYSDSLAASFFSSLISNELKKYPATKIVFNSDFNNAGLSAFYIKVENSVYDYATLSLTAGNGIYENPACSKIYGIIYRDTNENEVYTPGKGIAKKTVVIIDKKTFAKAETVITDNTGHFSATLLKHKEYIIQVKTETATGEILTEKNIYLDADNQFVKLGVRL